MRVAVSLAPLALVLAACSSAPAPGAMTTSRTAAEPPPATKQADEPQARAPLAIAEGTLDGPEARDPFRAFTKPTDPPPVDARRKAKRVAVSDLKLVGLVTRADTPRAMLVDPAGKGYIVTTGELVGRPEPVPGTSRVASFRVDRIREGDIVLVREDPGDPGAASVTRVIALPREPLLQAED
jgi:type IV pilus assembly protein PilP